MKDKTYWKRWCKAALVRAAKTVCQTAVATIGTASALGEVNWQMIVSASLLSGLVSILTSVAGIPEVQVENTDLPAV